MPNYSQKYFGYYYLLYFLSYFSIYYLPAITPLINVFILVVSYQLILKYNRLDIVVALMLFSRCMNGFIIPHSKVAYTVINILTNILPIVLYYVSILKLNDSFFDRKNLRRYKFTFLFFFFLTLSFILNIDIASDLVTRRYIPFLFFLIFLTIFHRPQNFHIDGMLRFFRATFFASMVLYFTSSYLSLTRSIIESDSVFSVAVAQHSYSLVYMFLVRNMGFVWDHRILAIVSYLYLALSLSSKAKYYRWDVLLSGLAVITTTSRGGMITFALILFVFLFQQYRTRVLSVLGIATAILIVFLVFEKHIVSPGTSKFLRSFNPNSSNNAISQRKVFSDYAMNAFYEKPLFGHGVGHLSSTNSSVDIQLGKSKVDVVTDAYWFVLLAEMGIVGFILYLLFLFEVFFSTKILNIALLLGFAVQLLGTDIPDMRFFYFAILVLVYVINIKLNETTKTLTLKDEKN